MVYDVILIVLVILFVITWVRGSLDHLAFWWANCRQVAADTTQGWWPQQHRYGGTSRVRGRGERGHKQGADRLAAKRQRLLYRAG